jgi:hypothetical protein
MTAHSILMTAVVPCEYFSDDLTDKIWTTFCSHSSVAQHKAQVLPEGLNEHE